LFILRTGKIGDSWFGGVDVDCMIGFFSIESDFKVCVVSGKGSDFSAVEREDMVDDCVNPFLCEISIVNAQIVVEPACLHHNVSTFTIRSISRAQTTRPCHKL